MFLFIVVHKASGLI